MEGGRKKYSSALPRAMKDEMESGREMNERERKERDEKRGERRELCEGGARRKSFPLQERG